ncbi:SPOR domain-containing protein [Bacteroidota bacterium]
MNLAKHISNLLYENEKVIIPEFGGFISSITNTSIHPVDYKFTPPLKEISFNQNLKDNDNLLINHISKTENISEAEAAKQISDFVEKTNKELKEGKKVQLMKIGFLFIDINGTINLDFDKKENYHIDSYGLSSFNSPAIQRKEVIDNMIEKAAVKTKTKKSRIGLWISIAAVVIILLVFSFLKRDLITEYIASSKAENEQEKEVTITISTERNTKIKKAIHDTNENIAVTEIDTVEGIINNENQVDLPETMEEIPPEDFETETKKYYIVAGCFSSMIKAEKYLVKLKEDGFAASIKGQTPKGLYRVCFNGYEKQVDASKALAEINSNGQYSGWILKIK